MMDLFSTVFIMRCRGGRDRRVYHVKADCPDVRKSSHGRRARLGSVLAGHFTPCRRCSRDVDLNQPAMGGSGVRS